MIWKIKTTIEELNQRCTDSLCSHLGILFTEIGEQHLTATMPVDERTCQPMGILHGGSTCALVETVGSVAANCCIDPELIAVGLNIDVSHVRQVKVGSTVEAVAKPLHLGRTTQVWEIKVYESERLAAAGRLTIAVIRKR